MTAASYQLFKISLDSPEQQPFYSRKNLTHFQRVNQQAVVSGVKGTFGLTTKPNKNVSPVAMEENKGYSSSTLSVER